MKRIPISPSQVKIIAAATSVLLTLELAALLVVVLSNFDVATTLRRGALVLALLALPFPAYMLLARRNARTLLALNGALLVLPVLAAVVFLFIR